MRRGTASLHPIPLHTHISKGVQLHLSHLVDFPFLWVKVPPVPLALMVKKLPHCTQGQFCPLPYFTDPLTIYRFILMFFYAF